MSLVKFKRRPLGRLIGPDFFDLDDFFEDRIWDPKTWKGRFWNGKTSVPAINIKETDDDFEVEMAAPGYDKKDFNITMENGCLNISAEKSATKEEKEGEYTRQEFSHESFERSLQLPDSIKDEAVEAKYDNGILRFKLTKKEEAKKQQPKVIKVS
ncbi:Hsp20/alpha crystallin family protein [[Muricauda] lutisoli]|uniref:Hsp20/alpha crystallin family protein n=1 Tax=[Muricauda] lutisoli TaxID=2816035 RepID=A0ABS3F029_9FLAO|nr:Hsp20/alpha crystallin family protein [[Muricauda] lutisoli]MBO0331866.1 Hsp20/alpha crystallin family protein [[Muricauda] lutisoli]